MITILVDLVIHARSCTCPESSKTVIGSRREDMAKRVPIEGPDGEVMGKWNLMSRPDALRWSRFWIGCIPGLEGIGHAGWGMNFIQNVVK
jgi:hypothetical protein